jgi:hypothetical protein
MVDRHSDAYIYTHRPKVLPRWLSLTRCTAPGCEEALAGGGGGPLEGSSKNGSLLLSLKETQNQLKILTTADDIFMYIIYIYI